MEYNKQIKKIAVSLITVFIMIFTVFETCGVFAQVTEVSTPDKVNYGGLKWQKKLGSGFENAPTPPLVTEDYVCVGSGNKLYKLNKETGAVMSSLTLDGSLGYALIPPAYGEGKIFIGLDGGSVEAVDEASFEKLWTQKADDGTSQMLTAITYSEGYIYTGTWGGNNGGKYFCLRASDGEAAWKENTHPHSEGYYNAAACIVGDFAIFGSDVDYTDKTATLKSVDKSTGKEIDKKQLPGEDKSGNIRSGIAYDNGFIYFTTQSAGLYKAELKEDGTLGDLSYCRLSGDSVSTPLIHEGKIYVGTEDAKIEVFDVESMERDCRAAIPGYPQGEMLLSTYGNNLYLYTTYNKTPGGIYFIEFEKEPETGKIGVKTKGNLFTPINKEYCISPVTSDLEGTLYYKNDSGYVMAVEPGYTLSATSTAGGSVLKSVNVKEGESFTFKMSPKSGYKIMDVKIDGVSKGSKVSYTFSKVKKPHSISAVYAKKKTNAFISAASAGYSGIKLKWNKMTGVSGYEIYRAASKNGKYSKIKTLNSAAYTSYTNGGLVTGKTYYYKIKAFYLNSAKKKVYCSISSYKYAKPKLSKTTVSTKAGTRKIKISWKKVGGASGYQIFRARSKSGKYSCIKAVSKKYLSYTNKKLTKGKTYYYKVRAYRVVSGKKVYGPLSNISYSKSK